MIFYPNGDINIFWEIPPAWSLYCHNPHKSWKRNAPQATHTITFWQDFEGDRLPVINNADLYFKDWPYDRIRPEACIPLYYCVGNRFVLLEKAFPAGFKCASLPMSLKEMRERKIHRKQMAKRKRLEAKEAKKRALELEKLENKKKGIRRKI